MLPIERIYRQILFHFILLHRCYVFYKLKFPNYPALSRSTSTVFHHILATSCLSVTFGSSQDTVHFFFNHYYICYNALWSGNFAVTISKILGASQVTLMEMNPPTNAGGVNDVGSIPGLRRSPGEGHGHPFQYSCLENPMDRGAW